LYIDYFNIHTTNQRDIRDKDAQHIASPILMSTSTFPWYILFLQMMLWQPSRGGITIPPLTEEMLLRVCTELKVAALLLHCQASNLTKRNYITYKSHMQNSRLDNDKNDLRTTTVKWEKENIVKYVTWNVRSVTNKEEELDTIFKEQNTDIAVRRETKKNKLKEPKKLKIIPSLIVLSI
jgi:hypothetical protein